MSSRYDRPGGGADGEPFGSAAEALPPLATRMASSRSLVSAAVLAFSFDKIALRGREFGLAGLAVDGEVVERF